MSSPEVDKFEATEDDLEFAMDPLSRRYRMSKKQALYGVFGDYGSDEERPQFGRKRKDYSAPVSFVSGGFKKGTIPSEEAGGDDDDDDVQFEAPVDRDSSSRPPQAAATFKATNALRATSRDAKASYSRSSIDEHFGSWERYSKGIGSKLLEKMGHKPGQGLGKNQQGIATPVEAFQRRGKGAIGYYGAEKASRLAQAKSAEFQDDAPAESPAFQPQWRRDRVAAKDKPRRPKYVYRTADELVRLEQIGALDQDDADAESEVVSDVFSQELSQVKIIDMTGREQKLLIGYQSLSKKSFRAAAEGPGSQADVLRRQKALRDAGGTLLFDVPELRHNLDLLVVSTERDIIRNNKRLQFEEDNVVNIKHELDKMDQTTAEYQQQVTALRDIMQTIDKLDKSISSNDASPLPIEDCVAMIARIKANYWQEYKLFGLHRLAEAAVLPLLKAHLGNWDIRNDPDQFAGEMKLLKEAMTPTNLGSAGPMGADDGLSWGGVNEMTSWDKLIWNAWMPKIRQEVARWPPREAGWLVEALDSWRPVVSDWIMDNVLTQLVLPKIQEEVDRWDPLSDVQPLHQWLHPWLSLMQSRFEIIYPVIRRKLGNALAGWHPSDASARLILDPWFGVWQPGHMDAFLLKFVVPKLSVVLDKFQINPQQQSLDAWNWVIRWKDRLPVQAMVQLLEQHFFPKWLHQLCVWLDADPNYEEISKWYTGWKSQMPAEISAHPNIKAQFNRALELMSRAVSHHGQAGAKENVQYLMEYETQRRLEQKRREAEARQALVATQMAEAQGPVGFRELLERKAADAGIVFAPLPGRYYEAKQVFTFGRCTIYVDRGVCFVLEPPGTWSPTSLVQLLDRAGIQ